MAIRARTAIIIIFIAFIFGLDYTILKQRFKVHERGGILVTGASSGIGRHAAIHLAKMGYIVFAGVRKPADVESLNAEKIPELRPVLLDVTDQESVSEAAADIAKWDSTSEGAPFFGLVNNAGVATGGPMEVLSIDAVQHVYDVNVFGLLRVTQSLLPTLRANKGRVVNIGSLAGLCALSMDGAYASTKFAVEGITDALRRELAPSGVSVSNIRPGYVVSEIQGKEFKNIMALNESMTDAHHEAYGALMYDYVMRGKAGEATAEGPEVVTAAVVDALTSAFPSPRYAVAGANGFPAPLAKFILWIMPDRFADKFFELQHFQQGKR